MEMKKIEFNSEKDWFNSRGIGGTTASAIMGQSPYKTANDVYNELVYGKEPQEDNEVFERGRILEPLIRNLFAFKNPNLKITEPPKYNWIFVDDEEPRLTGSLDGIIEDENGELGVLEIKTRQGSLEEWQDDFIPQNYYIQVLHYLMITKYKYAYIVCLYCNYALDNFKLITKKITYEEHKADIEKLRKSELSFLKLVDKRIRPKATIELPTKII